ncbi:MAG: flavodoxin [Lachnospiraceae bacterium]|nr:flavodoxin [Lachnospiraceae bacterium]
MNQGIIIYKSKYGSAKKYAHWLRDLTGFDCLEASKAAWNRADACDTILFCGGIYASGIAGLSSLKKNLPCWKDKKILVLCVGASPYEEAAFAEIRQHNMTGYLKEIPLFYGRGAWDESRMTFVDRILCGMLQKSLAKKDPDAYEPWMEALLSSAGQVCDWTDKKYLVPLLDALNSNSCSD